MKSTRYIYAYLLLAATGTFAAGCSAHLADDPVEEPVITDTPQAGGKAVLSMRIRLGDINYGEESRAIEDELPASPDEMMQSLRIIILDSKGYAEHNSYWQTTADNAVVTKSADFPVKANDTKTVILLANEASLSAANREYFEGINASAGEYVDLDEVRNLRMTGISEITGPIVMTDIHTVRIGNAPNTSVTLPITRAAVKLTYRITNYSTSSSQSVYSIGFNRGADRQYLFSGNVLATTGNISSRTYTINTSVAAGSIREFVRYIPEGPTYTGYQATLKLTRNGSTSTANLNFTTLPRNTHVVINISLNQNATPSITYQVCPWETKTIDIPDFN